MPIHSLLEMRKRSVDFSLHIRSHANRTVRRLVEILDVRLVRCGVAHSVVFGSGECAIRDNEPRRVVEPCFAWEWNADLALGREQVVREALEEDELAPGLTWCSELLIFFNFFMVL
jgi:hypothetical protein